MVKPTRDLKELDLFAISAVSLFLEIAFIRFINSTVQIMAYFNNFVILSAILGLGFGALLVHRTQRKLLTHVPMVAFLFIAMLAFLGIFGVLYESPDQIAWGIYYPSRLLPFQLVVFLVFVGNVSLFIPLGHQVGLCLQRFENRLVAYNYDLLGSLAGVIFFALMSYWQTAPWLWIALAGVPVIYLLRDAPKRLPMVVGVWALAILATFVPEQGVWSPYYKVTTVPVRSADADELLGYHILVDRNRIQDAINFEADQQGSRFGFMVSYYRLPYFFREPQSVLVLGGGSGNDTVIALANGAEEVDVVEIDPVLVEFGHRLHPQRPYLDPRVNVITDDARTYLRQSDKQYDLVVMNALDSHHQLPGLSTLRLESYMYTVEAFRDVRSHLRPDAIFLVHMQSNRPWMGQRLYWSLAEAFGRTPRLFITEGAWMKGPWYGGPFDSIGFVFGPDDILRQNREIAGDSLRELDAATFLAQRGQVELATDDWPHLYLSERTIPKAYIYVLLVIVALSLIAYPAFGKLALTVGNLHFFLLGASFMLLETRGLTQFALLFGSTWIVNAIVISAILLVVWFGNLLILKGLQIPKLLCYGLLLGSLLVLNFISLDFALEFPFALRVLSTALLVGTPIFFASLVFSYSFRKVRDTATAFGFNLLGIVVGGTLEYSSMIYGLSFLYVVAMAMYFLAMLADSDGPLRLGALAKARG